MNKVPLFYFEETEQKRNIAGPFSEMTFQNLDLTNSTVSNTNPLKWAFGANSSCAHIFLKSFLFFPATASQNLSWPKLTFVFCFVLFFALSSTLCLDNVEVKLAPRLFLSKCQDLVSKGH